MQINTIQLHYSIAGFLNLISNNQIFFEIKKNKNYILKLISLYFFSSCSIIQIFLKRILNLNLLPN
jgi:hypothetical protein